RLPLDQLGASRLPVPRPPLGVVGLKLEQVPAQRMLQSEQRRLRPFSGPPQGRLARPWGRGRRLAAGPALQQTTEGKRGNLARPQLRDEALRSRLLRGVVDQEVGPTGLGAKSAHTSTMTGRII